MVRKVILSFNQVISLSAISVQALEIKKSKKSLPAFGLLPLPHEVRCEKVWTFYVVVWYNNGCDISTFADKAPSEVWDLKGLVFSTEQFKAAAPLPTRYGADSSSGHERKSAFSSVRGSARLCALIAPSSLFFFFFCSVQLYWIMQIL